MNASDLLQAWEHGQSLPPLERLIYLLVRAGWQDAESLTIGRKNRSLLALHEELFGPQLACVVRCPQCDTKLEFTMSTTALVEPGQQEPAQTLTIQHDDYDLTIRQPQLRDLQIADGEGASLYAQCVVEVRSGEEAIAVTALPDSARQHVADALKRDDPLLDIQLALNCPDCSESWLSSLDLLAFVWQEIDQWGRRMLRTIHRLAAAYGWSEQEILALSAWRRNRYLELLSNG